MAYHLLDLGSYGGRVHIETRVIHRSDLKVGDFVYDPRAGYHGKVVEREVEKGRALVHWYKWDPAIEMPMREHLFTPGVVHQIIFDEDEMTPQEIKTLRVKLDLSPFEKGGPYN